MRHNYLNTKNAPYLVALALCLAAISCAGSEGPPQKAADVAINDGNLDDMGTLIAAVAHGGTEDNPVTVSVTLSQVDALLGTNSAGDDPLHKLFEAIPDDKFVSFDLSGYEGELRDISFNVALARHNKENLVGIELPDTLFSIGENAFCSCRRLAQITIPNSVESIGPGAFESCSGLTRVTIGSGVTTIGRSAFFACTSLVEVRIGGSVTTIGENAFMQCQKLSQVVIPDSVKNIGGSAFYSCGLSSVAMGKGVKSIGGSAFKFCGKLEKITIPASVTSIGVEAFGDSGLISLYVESVTPPTIEKSPGSNALDNAPPTLKIYVPRGKGDAYKKATGWSGYAGQIQEIA